MFISLSVTFLMVVVVGVFLIPDCFMFISLSLTFLIVVVVGAFLIPDCFLFLSLCDISNSGGGRCLPYP